MTAKFFSFLILSLFFISLTPKFAYADIPDLNIDHKFTNENSVGGNYLTQPTVTFFILFSNITVTVLLEILVFLSIIIVLIAYGMSLNI